MKRFNMINQSRTAPKNMVVKTYFKILDESMIEKVDEENNGNNENVVAKAIKPKAITSGMKPSQLSNAYNAETIRRSITSNPNNITIAIIIAYGSPNIVSDTNILFSDPYMNPDGFIPQLVLGRNINIYYQTKTGSTAFSTTANNWIYNASWSVECAMDVQQCLAMAPYAKIALVCSRTASLTDMNNAIKYANNIPNVCCMNFSWGTPEFSTEALLDSSLFNKVNIVYSASSGDDGASFGNIWPSVSKNIISVAGSTLSMSSNTFVSETVWNSTGGGYSKYVAKPSYQNSLVSGSKRTCPDIALDGNPSSGVPVYSSLYSSSILIVAGSSLSCPIFCGLVALISQLKAKQNTKKTFSSFIHQVLYNNINKFRDITVGSNGYNASKGYDLASGLGAPLLNNLQSVLLTL